MLDKSPVSGPGRGPPFCNSSAENIRAKQERRKEREERTCAGVQPRQDPGGTLRMNGVGEREGTHETSLYRAKSVFYFLTTRFIPFHRTFSRYKMLTHDYTGLALHHFDF